MIQKWGKYHILMSRTSPPKDSEHEEEKSTKKHKHKLALFQKKEKVGGMTPLNLRKYNERAEPTVPRDIYLF